MNTLAKRKTPFIMRDGSTDSPGYPIQDGTKSFRASGAWFPSSLYLSHCEECDLNDQRVAELGVSLLNCIRLKNINSK